MLATLLAVSLSPRLLAGSPLPYRTVAVISVQAAIRQIAIVPVAGRELPPDEPPRAPSAPPGQAAQQEVTIEIERVTGVERNDARGPVVGPGQIITVINQYVDQETPFTTGDSVEVRLRLVSEASQPARPHQQWWFFPPGSEEDISPPRHPFRGIVISAAGKRAN